MGSFVFNPSKVMLIRPDGKGNLDMVPLERKTIARRGDILRWAGIHGLAEMKVERKTVIKIN